MGAGLHGNHKPFEHFVIDKNNFHQESTSLPSNNSPSHQTTPPPVKQHLPSIKQLPLPEKIPLGGEGEGTSPI